MLDAVKRVIEDLSLLMGSCCLLDTVKRVFEDLSLLMGTLYLLETVKRVFEDLSLLMGACCVLDTVKRVMEDLSLVMLAHRSSGCGVSLFDDGCFMHWAVVTCSWSLGCCCVLLVTGLLLRAPVHTLWPGH